MFVSDTVSEKLPLSDGVGELVGEFLVAVGLFVMNSMWLRRSVRDADSVAVSVNVIDEDMEFSDRLRFPVKDAVTIQDGECDDVGVRITVRVGDGRLEMVTVTDTDVDGDEDWVLSDDRDGALLVLVSVDVSIAAEIVAESVMDVDGVAVWLCDDS